MIRQLDIFAFLAGLYYGMGVHLLTELSILILNSVESSQGLFQPCRYMGNAVFSSSVVLGTYPQWKILFSNDEEVNRTFNWSMSLFSLIFVGFGFTTAFVYPTELICSVYYTDITYIYDRLFLAAPCGVVLFSFAEVCGWNASLRLRLR